MSVPSSWNFFPQHSESSTESTAKPFLWNLIQGFFHVMAGNSHILSNIPLGSHEVDSPSCATHVLACLYCERKNMELLVSLLPLTVLIKTITYY